MGLLNTLQFVWLVLMCVYFFSITAVAVVYKEELQESDELYCNIQVRVPCSKSQEWDSWTFIQPCMWFLHDGTPCCLAHGELDWLFIEPDTGLDHCP